MGIVFTRSSMVVNSEYVKCRSGLWLCSQRMTVELRHLRSFLAIAEEGNITRAAARLHVSQPALSRTLAQLERDLAVRLVDRSTHHLTLTEAGTAFAVTAGRAVRQSTMQSPRPARQSRHFDSDTTGAARPRRRDHAVVEGSSPTGGAIAAQQRAHRRPSRWSRRRGIGSWPHHRTLRSVGGHRRRAAHGRGALRASSRGREARVARRPLERDVDRQLDHRTTTLELWPQSSRPTLGPDLATLDDWLIAIATSAGVGVTPASTATCSLIRMSGSFPSAMRRPCPSCSHGRGTTPIRTRKRSSRTPSTRCACRAGWN